LNISFSTFSISSKTSLFVNRINFNHIMHYGFFPFYFFLFPFSFFLSPFPFFLFPSSLPLKLIFLPLTLFSFLLPLGLGETVNKILTVKNQLLESGASLIVLNISFSTFSISSKTSLFVNRINFNHIMHYGFFPFYFTLYTFSFFLFTFFSLFSSNLKEKIRI